MIVKALKTKSWPESMEKNNWTPAVMAGRRSRSSSTTNSPACAPRWSSPAWSDRGTVSRAPDFTGRFFPAARPQQTPSRTAVAGGAGVFASAGAGAGAMSIPSGGLWRRRAQLPALAGRDRAGAVRRCSCAEARTGGFRRHGRRPGAERGYWPAFAWVSAGLLRQRGADHHHRLHPELHAVLCAGGAGPAPRRRPAGARPRRAASTS